MKIKDVIFAIAIVILTIFVTFYGINMFFPSPDYQDFCNDSKFQAVVVQTQEACVGLNGRWSPQQIGCVSNKESCPQGYCDLYFECNEDFQDAMKLRSRNVFFIALPLGILVVALGAFFFGLEFVGAGIMGGGVGTLIYGSGAYWPYTENWVRFLLSLAGLVILVWFAYFLSKRKEKKGKR